MIGKTDIRTALMTAVKAAESAQNAVESLQLALVLLARQMEAETPLQGDSGACQHYDRSEIETMGGLTVICNDCGETVADAMHHGR